MSIDLQELFAAGYMPCTAGGISTAIVQEGHTLFALVSTADQACNVSEGTPRSLGCSHQPGGLKLVKLATIRTVEEGYRETISPGMEPVLPGTGYSEEAVFFCDDH